jgi:antitoxin PrlF
MEATLTSKGQITIPKEVRDALHLRAGDRLDFVVQPDGTVRVLPVKGSVKALKGILPKPTRAVSLEDMERAIRLRAGQE